MPIQFTIQKDVKAPPERVFAVFTDFANAATNATGIKKLEVLTKGPIGKGTRFRETRIRFGKEATEEMEIVDFQHGKSYSVGCKSGGAESLARLDFAPKDGGTNVHMDFQLKFVSLFARIMAPLAKLMMKSIRQAMEKDLVDLKAVAERTESPGSTGQGRTQETSR